MIPGGPVVWVIGPDHWARALLRAELIERGYDAVGHEDPLQALLALRRRRARPAAVLIDLRGVPDPAGQRAALRSLGVPVVELHRPTTVGEAVAEVARVAPPPGSGQSGGTNGDEPEAPP